MALLREVATAPLHWLVDQTGETANVVVLAGTEVRFIMTVESGLTAVGVVVGNRAGGPPAGLSIALPTARLTTAPT